jgi:hypothetical protein
MTEPGDMTATFRPYYRDYIPAIEEESMSGWQPITYATADSGAMIERFGNYYSNSIALCYSVRKQIGCFLTGLWKIEFTQNPSKVELRYWHLKKETWMPFST